MMKKLLGILFAALLIMALLPVVVPLSPAHGNRQNPTAVTISSMQKLQRSG